MTLHRKNQQLLPDVPPRPLVLSRGEKTRFTVTREEKAVYPCVKKYR